MHSIVADEFITLASPSFPQSMLSDQTCNNTYEISYHHVTKIFIYNKLANINCMSFLTTHKPPYHKYSIKTKNGITQRTTKTFPTPTNTCHVLQNIIISICITNILPHIYLLYVIHKRICWCNICKTHNTFTAFVNLATLHNIIATTYFIDNHHHFLNSFSTTFTYHFQHDQCSISIRKQIIKHFTLKYVHDIQNII